MVEAQRRNVALFQLKLIKGAVMYRYFPLAEMPALLPRAREQVVSNTRPDGDWIKQWLPRLLSFFIISMVSLTPIAAFSQVPTKKYDPYGDSFTGARSIVSIGASVAGDVTNLYDGATEFHAIDLSVPGNNNLKVEFRRRYKVKATPRLNLNNALGDWDLDVPHLYGVFRLGDRWPVATSSHKDRCTSRKRPPAVLAGNGQGAFGPSEYWNGNYLHIPGESDQQMLVWDAVGPAPTDGASYAWATNQNWFFSCLSESASPLAYGEGFLAVSPSGDKYYFDKMIFRTQTASMVKITSSPLFQGADDGHYALGANSFPQTSSPNPDLDRWEAWLVPSKIVDRHGNWVTYKYDSNDNLTEVSSSDGRLITIAYDGQDVRSVQSGSRIVTYTYDSKRSLSTVSLPDQSSWKIGFAELSALRVEPSEYPSSCDVVPTTGALIGTPSGWIQHPSGARVDFAFAMTRHGLSYVPKECVFEGFYNGSQIGANLRFSYLTDTLSLANKTVSGPGLASAAWTYTYGSPNNSWGESCSSQVCAETKNVVIRDPGNNQTLHVFGNRFGVNTGLLVRREILVGNNTAFDHNSYFTGAAWGGTPKRKYGLSQVYRDDVSMSEHVSPLVERTIIREDTAFRYHVNSFDLFMRPTVVEKSSPVAPLRTESTWYSDNFNRWVLGQVERLAVNGIEVSRSVFDSATALPLETFKYGQREQTLTYTLTAGPEAGTLKSVTDALNRTRKMSSWKRGVPRLIQHPDDTSLSAIIDDDGTIASLIDEEGAKTCYEYDEVGRLTKIIYPSESLPGSCDTNTWRPTVVAFEEVSSSEYGIPTGHWRETVSTGTGQKSTYFDALWRPLLVREHDAADEIGTTRFNRFSYDHEGRVSFASYPGTTHLLASGIWTEYDPLGRTTSVSQNSEYGLLTTRTEYLSGLRTRVTNPSLLATTTSFMAYDTPTYDMPVRIDAPEQVSTSIARDVFGKPLKVTRSGPDG